MEISDIRDLRHPVTDSSAAKRLHTIDYGARIAAPTTFDEFDDAEVGIISGTMPLFENGKLFRTSGNSDHLPLHHRPARARRLPLQPEFTNRSEPLPYNKKSRNPVGFRPFRLPYLPSSRERLSEKGRSSL